VSRTVRLWILAVALCSFLAGAVVGVALPAVFAGPHAEDGSAVYAQNLAEKYGLTGLQHDRLRMVLQEGERRELEILKGAKWSQMPPALRGARLEANRKTEQRIRFVLDESQRALYDRDSRPPGSGAQGAAGRRDR